MMHGAGFPPGVFNMVNGDGPYTGDALTKHPDMDMISFTGSTRAGRQVAANAALGPIKTPKKSHKIAPSIRHTSGETTTSVLL